MKELMTEENLALLYIVITLVIGMCVLLVDGIILGIISTVFFYMSSAFILTTYHGYVFNNPFLWAFEVIQKRLK